MYIDVYNIRIYVFMCIYVIIYFIYVYLFVIIYFIYMIVLFYLYDRICFIYVFFCSYKNWNWKLNSMGSQAKKKIDCYPIRYKKINLSYATIYNIYALAR